MQAARESAPKSIFRWIFCQERNSMSFGKRNTTSADITISNSRKGDIPTHYALAIMIVGVLTVMGSVYLYTRPSAAELATAAQAAEQAKKAEAAKHLVEVEAANRKHNADIERANERLNAEKAARLARELRERDVANWKKEALDRCERLADRQGRNPRTECFSFRDY
jgi:hypothetical protein